MELADQHIHLVVVEPEEIVGNLLKTSRSGPGFRMLLKYWLILGLVGVTLPILLFFLIKLDYFVQWQVFAPSPADLARLEAGNYGELWVSLKSGQVLNYFGSEDHWTQVDTVPELPVQACDQHTPAFDPLAHAPQALLDCISSQSSYAESTYTVFYALDKQGNIWRWVKMTSVYDYFAIALWAVAFGMAGVLIGSVIWVVRRIRYSRKMRGLPT